MDFKKFAGQASSFLDKKETPAADTAAPPADGSAPPAGAAAGGAGPADGQDYGDKAFGLINKQTGNKFNAEQSEKITDGARGAFEKATGKTVDPKYSN